MSWNPARQDGHDIEPCLAGPPPKPSGGGPCDPASLVRRDGFSGDAVIGAGLDLDEADNPRRRARDKIDLTKTGFYAAAENAIAFAD